MGFKIVKMCLIYWILPVFFACLANGSAAQSETEKFKGYRLNQIQLIGSHNSYKTGMEPALLALISKMDSARASVFAYGHISLKEQLNMGLRNLELDVVHDPTGGRFTKPMAFEWMELSAITPQPYDNNKDLDKPGLKVLHVPDVDIRSEHLLFIDCLKELLQWSIQHPGHIPVTVTINAKDRSEKGLMPLLPFGAAALDSIDFEIKQVFPNDKLITPDLIRGKGKNLAHTILGKGWPLLENLSGRFLFVLDETGQKLLDYTRGHEALEGRVMFVNEADGSPNAAFMIINDPQKDGKRIKEMVEKGYMVRTRSDANTVEARAENYDRFKAAMLSGAQVITTDYYLPSTYFPSSFRIVFPTGGYIRANPVARPKKRP